MKKTQVIIEQGADGTYSAFIESNNLPYGLIGDGNTVEEVKADFLAAYEDMRQHYANTGEKFIEAEFEFKYDVSSFLQCYAYAFTLAGLGRITGINQYQLSHYINGVSKPSPKTIRKIEQRIHEFGKEIASVNFS